MCKEWTTRILRRYEALKETGQIYSPRKERLKSLCRVKYKKKGESHEAVTKNVLGREVIHYHREIQIYPCKILLSESCIAKDQFAYKSVMPPARAPKNVTSPATTMEKPPSDARSSRAPAAFEVVGELPELEEDLVVEPDA